MSHTPAAEATGRTPDHAADASRTAEFVAIEAAALQALAFRLGSRMAGAVEQTLALLVNARAAGLPLILTGLGKSGLIAQKVAATFRSTGTPAHFLHAAEALHGDLGLVLPGAPVAALSYSGETEEMVALLPALARLGCPVVAWTGCAGSRLAAAAQVHLDCSISEEACPHNLAPTASTTVMLALGDALALEVSRRAGFRPEDFAYLHPGGRLGQQRAGGRDRMHPGEAVPTVDGAARLPEVMHEMSRKRLGMTTVLSPTRELMGILVDGDLRRLLERTGPALFHRTAAEMMNPAPETIGPESWAAEALARMQACKITSLVVMEAGQVCGVIHLHDVLDQTPHRGPG